MTIEGKTKRVEPLPPCALFSHKDDITAGDGRLHDTFPGKGALSNRTTSNVFRLLKACGLPVAWYAQVSPTAFIGPLCDMILLEVVVRREAHGSYLKRNPGVQKGARFDLPVVEFYLKTKGKEWNGRPLPCDDPFLKFYPDQNRCDVYEPSKPLRQPILDVYPSVRDIQGANYPASRFDKMAMLATQVFLILEQAWITVAGLRLADFKVEFGHSSRGQLMLADVIDNDSWRLVDAEGTYLDKQVYREGGTLDVVQQNYLKVADFTDCFGDPGIVEKSSTFASSGTGLFPRYQAAYLA